ncbi:MAG TPA: Gfo/Idh/MocA family oxidoreductase [Anaerohalosphaeraceae bacterium]|nr:Gfo/Idh/MocA family oxidoreductase [Anaerohalosphaeraceae bacterium]
MVNVSNQSNSFSRRSFLKGAGVSALGFPWIATTPLFGRTAPSNRITLGFIGVGGMGMGNLRGFLNQPGVQAAAVCDADRRHLQEGLAEAGLDISCGTTDFRELLAREDIDAVVISTPDHWHVPMALAAVRAGKDVYCEKPLTLTIAEGRILSDAVQRYGRVFQTGSHQRSDVYFHRACQLVRNGRIGDLKKIYVEIPPNNRTCPPQWSPEPVPPELDYDLWLGPAPWAPYTTQRCHYTFRFISDYSGGQLTNWGSHQIDIAQWGHGTDYTGPVWVEGTGEFPKEGLFDTALFYDLVFTYADGVQLFCRTGNGTGSVLFEGTRGKIFVSRERLSSEPEHLVKSAVGKEPIQLYYSRDHRRNFLECIRSRKTTAAPAEIGHRTASICHMGNIAVRLGRPLRWDPVKEEFVGDEQANRLRFRPMRSPWNLV